MENSSYLLKNPAEVALKERVNKALVGYREKLSRSTYLISVLLQPVDLSDFEGQIELCTSPEERCYKPAPSAL